MFFCKTGQTFKLKFSINAKRNEAIAFAKKRTERIKTFVAFIQRPRLSRSKMSRDLSSKTHIPLRPKEKEGKIVMGWWSRGGGKSAATTTRRSPEKKDFIPSLTFPLSTAVKYSNFESLWLIQIALSIEREASSSFSTEEGKIGTLQHGRSASAP